LLENEKQSHRRIRRFEKSLNLKRLNHYKKTWRERMKSWLAAGIILVFISLTLSVGIASVKGENATNNTTLPENIDHVSNTNVNTIQNNSLNIILIRDLTQMINIIMPQNTTNATEAMISLKNITSSPL
jgi:hypothetical protein